MISNIDLKESIIINALGKYSKYILTVIVNAILARLLTPDDYGLVAVVTVFLVFFSNLADTGFSVAVVQNKKLSKSDLNSIFTCSVYISIMISILFTMLAYPVSWFYNEQKYVDIVLLLSISLLFNSMNMVPIGILNKEKKFKTIAYRNLVVYLFASVCAIWLAYFDFRYFSLVIQGLISAAIAWIWNFYKSDLEFVKSVDVNAIKKVFTFSLYQFYFNLVCWFSRYLDNFLIGIYLGSFALGIYSQAYNLMLLPITGITHVITTVLHPVLCEFQNDKEILYDKYYKVIEFITIIAIFIESFALLAYNEIVTCALGNNWSLSAVCFRMLALSIITQMITGTTGAVFQSLGSTKLLFKAGITNVIVTTIAIIISVFTKKSIDIISMYVSLSYIFHFFYSFYILIKYGFKFSYLEFLLKFKLKLILFFGMLFSVYVYNYDIDNNFISLVVKFLYCSMVYIFLLMLTGEYKKIKMS